MGLIEDLKNIDWFKTRKYDRVHFLQKTNTNIWRYRGSKFINPEKEMFSWNKRHYRKPKSINYLDNMGRGVHFVNYDDGNAIPFLEQDDATIDVNEQDLFISKKFASNFAQSLSGGFRADGILLIAIFGAGVGLGYIINHLITSGAIGG